MGKKILVQRRGRGTTVFQAPRKHKIAPAKYLRYKDAENESAKIILVDLMHEMGRSAPLAKYEFENTRTPMYLPAVEGITVGEEFIFTNGSELKVGNIYALKDLPESTPLSNIESVPGDGGKYCRTSGSSGKLVAKTSKTVSVELTSGRIREFHPSCRATIGVVAGGGRTEKPFLKAGKKFYFKEARGKLGAYPNVSGVAMNHHVHPYGGSQHKSPKMSTTVSRHAPPGRKIGLIAARRTGRKTGKASKIK
jgi:large subunit ribosomal protein L2